MTDASTMSEQVLVVPTMLFHELGYFQGFHADVDRYLDMLLDPAHTQYRPRAEVEEDPSYKQLIPYCIFRHNGEIFYYRRGGGSGEGRLRKKRSVGIGGHISVDDGRKTGDFYREGMHREIEEEVDVQTGYSERIIGLLNDDATPVGQVHLGVVHLFELEAAKVLPRESSILETGFASPVRLTQDRDDFETWSQICLDFLNTAEI